MTLVRDYHDLLCLVLHDTQRDRDVEGPPLLVGESVPIAAASFMTAVPWLFGYVVILCKRLREAGLW